MNGLNVLVLTRNAWDNTNSVGNTMSNFFAGRKDIGIANIYFRSSRPDNTVCTRYYHVTEKDILRHWFSPEKCGSAFDYRPVKKEKAAYSKEKKLISLIHRLRFNPAYLLSEKLWNSRKWINSRLDRFISDFKPDVVFAFAKSAPQYYRTIRYLYEKYRVKVVLWIADDEYTALSASGTKKDRERIERLRYIIDRASEVRGCSEEICGFYNEIFGCHAAPLYKSCRFTVPARTEVNHPLRMIYAGNLLFGRGETLKRIIRELTAFNASFTRATLEIYSNTPLPQKEIGELEIPGTSSFCGVKPYAEIMKIMSDSDLVLHIESFEEQEIRKTKYSFSTKIIDCLQSGSVMLAVGPAEIASIKYIKRIPGAFVIVDESAVGEGIASALEDSGSYPERAKSIRAFAQEHHAPDKNRISFDQL